MAVVVGPIVVVLLLLAIALCVVAMLALLRLRTARRQAEWLLQSLIDGAVDHAMVVLDPAGRVTQWNSGAQRLHGYTAAEILGRHCAYLYTDEDRAANLPQRSLELAARQGRCAFTHQRVSKGGRRFVAELVIHAQRDRSGQLLGFSSIERDISAAVQQQQLLSETRAALVQAQKMAAVGRLSNGIAHDFNNVVHVIKNCVEALERHCSGQPQMTEFLLMIRRNAERGAGLSQHLLGLARHQPLNPMLTNVNEVVADVAELLRHTLSENIVLEVTVGEEVPWAVIDANQLEATLMYLAVNARDAMPDGGTLSITTSEWQEQGRPGHYTMIDVGDTGAGEHSEVAATGLAQPLVVGEQDGELGLAAARSFMSQCGGKLIVERQPEQGTHVKLCLPCRAR